MYSQLYVMHSDYNILVLDHNLQSVLQLNSWHKDQETNRSLHRTQIQIWNPSVWPVVIASVSIWQKWRHGSRDSVAEVHQDRWTSSDLSEVLFWQLRCWWLVELLWLKIKREKNRLAEWWVRSWTGGPGGGGMRVLVVEVYEAQTCKAAAGSSETIRPLSSAPDKT